MHLRFRIRRPNKSQNYYYNLCKTYANEKLLNHGEHETFFYFQSTKVIECQNKTPITKNSC